MLPLRTITTPRSLQCTVAFTKRCVLESRRSVYNTPIRLSRPRTYEPIDVAKLLETPTWSVEALLPSDGNHLESPSISPQQLRHLLRLSALPPPKSLEEEANMLNTLSSQLHFVNDIRNVDTTGVPPLQSIRDETAAGVKEQEIGLDELKSALDQEQVKGAYYKRIRRRRDAPIDEKGEDEWDVLAAAEKKVGRYFVVDGGKES